MPNETISSIRKTPDNLTVLTNLGLLADLAGTWEGKGFNLIARPDFAGKSPGPPPCVPNLYLELNQTSETLEITPIGSSIPNRGFGQGDIELFGLTYLQKISDSVTGGALHIEPGIWVTQPATTYPPEAAPDPKAQIIARMGNIPHGNSMLAQGVASSFSGPPTLSPGATLVGGGSPAFSVFPSFNSTPFKIPTPPAVPILNAAGSSEKLTASKIPGAKPFGSYDITVTDCCNSPRTPCPASSPALPTSINGVLMQDVINDPIKLLQTVISHQVADGCSFQGTVLNIATQATITFFQNPNSAPTDPTVTVKTNGAGGIENILFLEGGEPVGNVGPNADTALVYATFWIEKVTPKGGGPSFVQLQYAQMVILNFAILAALPTVITLGWPHITVATLTKPFA